MVSKGALSHQDGPGKAAKIQRSIHTIPQDGTNEGNLCSRCEKVDLRTMFAKESTVKDLGYLESFMDPTCPFCTVIWDCIRLHWGSASPLEHGARPRLYIQSKEWGTFRTHASNKLHHIYRPVLAITEQPPNFQLRRRKVWTDKHHRFIVGELELLGQIPAEQDAVPLLRREIGPFLDIDILRGWLKACEEHDHDSTPDHGFFRLGFRLIDVEELRLVEKTEPCEYLALSYVWGSLDPDSLRTTKSNVHYLQRPHALKQITENVGKEVPRTIAHAMELCKALTYRYLWVDSLCIIQDDEHEKQRLIHGMGHVYENASLTIFATSGQHSDAGLAGITARTGIPCGKKFVIKLPESSLSISIAPTSLEEQVRKSPWNTRAWTLQEQALSERRLYFAADEVFFECSSCNLRELYAVDNLEYCVLRQEAAFWGRGRKYGVAVPLVSILPRGTNNSWEHYMYASMVSNYSRRNLSYSDDVLNAFSGVYQRCTGAHPSQRSIVSVQGLNDASFAHSLLWFIAESDPKKIKRRNAVHGTTLASWSWASWIAPIDFVCVLESSFPAPYTQHWHFWEKLYCFVSEWSLTFSDGDSVCRSTIHEQPGAAKILDRHDLLKPIHLLAMFSEKPQPQEVHDVLGSLAFVAPCISLSPSYRITSDEKVSQGGHLLVLSGLEKHYCIIKFDSEDQGFTEFVLILYDHCYVALCVRTVGGISRRIGVAQLSTSKERWEAAMSMGLLSLQWKQVCLV